MPEAPLPPDELARIAALRRTGILDTGPEPAFDDVAGLAARICDAPTSLVSLVDEGRQWFKARVGLEPTETPRSASFCAHAILSEDGLVVPDALADPRFADNPLVLGPPHIRFYAGAPLRLSSGEALGTLNVIDYTPRTIAPAQWEALRVLARQVTLQLELRVERAELASTNRELARLTAELEAFGHTLSHDLRAPVRTLRTHLGLLREEASGRLPDGARQRLDRLEAVAARMGGLVDGILSLSRLSRAALEPRDVDVSALADEVVRELREASPGREIEVAVAPDLHAHGDPALVRAILENLLANAWKFTAGKPGAHIEVGRAPDGALFVRDDGAGFDMRDLDRLFQPFQRLHGKEFEGTGIGLATVRRIVERHGGRIRAEGAPGKGATIWFTLPGA